MAMNNQFQLIGNLSSAPRLEKTPTTNVCLMQIAVTSFFYDKANDTNKEITEFHFIRTYGVKATNASKYLIKGQQLSVSGHIKSWYDKDKNEGGMYLVCDELLYGNKPKLAGSEQSNVANSAPSGNPEDEDFNRMYNESFGKTE